MTVNRRVAALAAVSAVTLTLASCASSDREDSAGASGSGGGGDTITFGAAGAPAMFDPFYGTDGETFRPARQIFETLVDFKPGTADLAPGLATKWTPSNGGKTWTFDLQQNVKFTDGTAFNADAVCKNFTRMFDQNAAGQTAASYWADNMGGFKSKGAAEALYKSCSTVGRTRSSTSAAPTTSRRATGRAYRGVRGRSRLGHGPAQLPRADLAVWVGSHHFDHVPQACPHGLEPVPA